MMVTVGYALSERQVEKVVADVDADEDGRISYEEFKSIMAEEAPQEVRAAELRAAFDLYDTDGSGKISRRELRKALKCCGKRVSWLKVRSIMKKADLNNDGELGKSTCAPRASRRNFAY